MSTKKPENINNIKNKENISQSNSKILNRSFKKINEIPMTTAMSNFMEDLSEKQKILQKEIENQRNTISEAEKKIYFLSAKMFPLIESRYNKIKNDNKKTIVNMKNNMDNLKKNYFHKSGSEIGMNLNKKFLLNNIFKTSIDSVKHNPIRINLNQISTPKQLSFNNSVIGRKSSNIKKILSLSTPINKINKEKNTINFNESTASNPKYRRKKFKVDVIKGWEFVHGFNPNKCKDKSLVEDKIYQKNLISNQIEIIIDNTNFFKLKNVHILEAQIRKNFINIEFLTRLNKLIEETSGLIIEIGHSIINDYESFTNELNKTNKLNPPEMIEGQEVYNERIEFNKNIKVLNESLKFLSITYEIYLILNKTSDYILPTNKIIRIRHFLSRARYNVNRLIIISKKYIDTTQYENSIVNLYNSQKKLIQNNEKLVNKQYFNLEKLSKDEFENFREKTNSEYGKDKMRRLNSLLSGVKESNFGTNKNKPKKCKYIDLEDKMFNKIVKYMEPNVKNKFEAFSITQKKNKNKFERKVYKFNF